MLLILGCTEDRLSAEVHRRVEKRGLSTARLGEAELLDSTPFSLTIDRADRGGFVQCNDRVIPLHDITGVLFRHPRVWWPSPEFDLQDQFFVYHETSSSWFSLLSGLACPQVNQFGLAWWVHDLSYAGQLREGLADCLGLATAEASVQSPPPRRTFPTPVSPSENSRHVYLIGEAVVPRTARDHGIAALVASKTSALARWQQDTGISFCRIDMREEEETELMAVEPMPMLDDESFDIVSEVGERVARLLS
jgi:hypothetical protein